MLQYLWNHQNMSETGVVRATVISVNDSTKSRSIIEIHFRFSYMKICCVFSLELPQRGDSNEYTQYIIFYI